MKVKLKPLVYEQKYDSEGSSEGERFHNDTHDTPETMETSRFVGTQSDSSCSTFRIISSPADTADHWSMRQRGAASYYSSDGSDDDVDGSCNKTYSVRENLVPDLAICRLDAESESDEGEERISDSMSDDAYRQFQFDEMKNQDLLYHTRNNAYCEWIEAKK